MFKNIIEKLKPAIFNWKDDEKKKKSFGFIAQDLLEIFPEDEYDIVMKGPNGYYVVNYYQIIPILVSEVQKLSTQVAELKEKISKFDKE